jgi:hypothetical protein
MKRRYVLFAVLCAVLALSGCRSKTVSANANLPEPRQFIVAIDLSASRSLDMEKDAQSFLHDLVGQLQFGDELVLLQVQQSGLADHPRRWRGDLPTPSDPLYISGRDNNHLRAARAGLALAVDSFFKTPTDTIEHTDILTTLHIASEAMQDARGRSTTLLLLSDMLQSSNGIEMYKLSKMPPPTWTSQQKSLGLVPPLLGACVVVVGADATNATGMRIKKFWQDYFIVAGASLKDQEYRATPPRAARTMCE